MLNVRARSKLKRARFYRLVGHNIAIIRTRGYITVGVITVFAVDGVFVCETTEVPDTFAQNTTKVYQKATKTYQKTP